MEYRDKTIAYQLVEGALYGDGGDLELRGVLVSVGQPLSGLEVPGNDLFDDMPEQFLLLERRPSSAAPGFSKDDAFGRRHGRSSEPRNRRKGKSSPKYSLPIKILVYVS